MKPAGSSVFTGGLTSFASMSTMTGAVSCWGENEAVRALEMMAVVFFFDKDCSARSCTKRTLESP